jgi:hypothetical protein
MFHTNHGIYTMDAAGRNVMQITVQQRRRAWDHVALSPDGLRVVANYWDAGNGDANIPKFLR